MVLNMTKNKRIDAELLERVLLDLEGRTSITKSESCRATHNLDKTNNTCAKDSPVESVHVSSSEESIVGRSQENEHLMELLGKILQQVAHVSMIIFFSFFLYWARGHSLFFAHISTTHTCFSYLYAYLLLFLICLNLYGNYLWTYDSYLLGVPWSVSH